MNTENLFDVIRKNYEVENKPGDQGEAWRATVSQNGAKNASSSSPPFHKMEVSTIPCPSNDSFISPTPSSGSEEEPSVDMITLDQIFPYYDFEPNMEEDVAKSIRTYKMSMVKRTIDRINRSLVMIKRNWPESTPLQIYIAFQMAYGDPEEMVFSLTKSEFRNEVNKEYRERLQLLKNPSEASTIKHEIKVESSDDEEEDEVEVDFNESPISSPTSKKAKVVTAKKIILKPLPCPKDVSPQKWKKWSPAHQHSYMKREKNANSYLYRNLPPGEKQKNGPWTSEENANFLRRWEELRDDMEIHGTRWGLFSQTIPGRVGYQCANYYRKLIAEGVIRDDNYYVDEEGKLRMKSRSAANKAKKEKRERLEHEPAISKYERKALKNPFPKLIDEISGEEIRVPTMSPDGYILDYNTWMHLLSESQLDPFTRKKFNKRQLVIITRKNLEEHQNKFKNVDLSELTQPNSTDASSETQPTNEESTSDILATNTEDFSAETQF